MIFISLNCSLWEGSKKEEKLDWVFFWTQSVSLKKEMQVSTEMANTGVLCFSVPLFYLCDFPSGIQLC